MSIIIIAFPAAPKVDPEAVRKEDELNKLIKQKVTGKMWTNWYFLMPLLLFWSAFLILLLLAVKRSRGTTNRNWNVQKRDWKSKRGAKNSILVSISGNTTEKFSDSLCSSEKYFSLHFQKTRPELYYSLIFSAEFNYFLVKNSLLCTYSVWFFFLFCWKNSNFVFLSSNHCYKISHFIGKLVTYIEKEWNFGQSNRKLVQYNWENTPSMNKIQFSSHQSDVTFEYVTEWLFFKSVNYDNC